MIRINRKIVSLFFLVLNILLFSACGSKDNNNVDILIGVCQRNTNENWQIAFQSDIASEADNYENVQCIYFNADENIEKQCKDIEAMIQRAVDIIIISPCEDKYKMLEKSLDEALDQGIAVIVVGNVAKDFSAYTMNIYTNNYQAGWKAGKTAAEILNGKGIILEMQKDPSSTESREMTKGFNDAIREYPQIKKEYVIAGYGTTDSATLALKRSEIDLKKNKVDLIFAHNNEMLVGAHQFCRAKGVSKKLVGVDYMLGSNMDLEKYKLLKLTAYVGSKTGGAEAICYGKEVLEGKRIPQTLELDFKIIYGDNDD